MGKGHFNLPVPLRFRIRTEIEDGEMGNCAQSEPSCIQVLCFTLSTLLHGK